MPPPAKPGRPPFWMVYRKGGAKLPPPTAWKARPNSVATSVFPPIAPDCVPLLASGSSVRISRAGSPDAMS